MLDPLDPRVTEALRSWRTQIDAGISSQEALQQCALLCRGASGALFAQAAERTAHGAGIRAVLEPLAPVLSEGERATLAAGWNAGRIEAAIDTVIRQREAWRNARRHIISKSIVPVLTLLLAAFVAPLPGLLIGHKSILLYVLYVAIPLGLVGGMAAAVYWSFVTRARAALTRADGTVLPPSRVDRTLLAIPLVSHAERQRNLAEFGDLLGNLLSAGAPIVEALELCMRAMRNGLYRESVARLQQSTAKGNGFALTLRHEPENLWPHEFVSAVAVGEQSGNLDGALKRAAENARESYLRIIDQLATVIPRVVYFAVTLYVAINALSLLLNFYIKPMDDLMKDLP